VKKLLPQGMMTVLTGQPEQTNTLDAPFAVSPVVTPVAVKGKKLDIMLKPFSFTVIKLGMK
jgi:alpha-L-arabinofuranosidase